MHKLPSNFGPLFGPFLFCTIVVRFLIQNVPKSGPKHNPSPLNCHPDIRDLLYYIVANPQPYLSQFSICVVYVGHAAVGCARVMRQIGSVGIIGRLGLGASLTVFDVDASPLRVAKGVGA